MDESYCHEFVACDAIHNEVLVKQNTSDGENKASEREGRLKKNTSSMPSCQQQVEGVRCARRRGPSKQGSRARDRV